MISTRIAKSRPKDQITDSTKVQLHLALLRLTSNRNKRLVSRKQPGCSNIATITKRPYKTSYAHIRAQSKTAKSRMCRCQHVAVTIRSLTNRVTMSDRGTNPPQFSDQTISSNSARSKGRRMQASQVFRKGRQLFQCGMIIAQQIKSQKNH